jgi:glycosyltransferase involved in cell wall biosynthesis
VLHGCYRGSRAQSAALAGSVEAHRALGSFDRPALFVVLSEFMRDKLGEAGIAQDRMRVKPNFAWPLPLRAGPGSYFLSLGRLSPEKGLDTVLRGWRGHGRLLVAGDGPDRERLATLAPRGVELIGAVDQEQVPALLADARALVFPSRSYEGSPRAVIEAFAAGVPVIASDLGGLPEHVEHERNGLLVAPRDVDAWSLALARLTDDDLSLELGAGAYRTWSARFTPDVALGALEALYAEAIARGDERRA